jgi:hypothetical protein
MRCTRASHDNVFRATIGPLWCEAERQIKRATILRPMIPINDLLVHSRVFANGNQYQFRLSRGDIRRMKRLLLAAS